MMSDPKIPWQQTCDDILERAAYVRRMTRHDGQLLLTDEGCLRIAIASTLQRKPAPPALTVEALAVIEEARLYVTRDAPAGFPVGRLQVALSRLAATGHFMPRGEDPR